MTDITTARDEIFGLLKPAWDAGSVLVPGVSAIPYVHWQGLQETETLPTDKPYARARLQHGDGTQQTMAEVGSRRFRYQGIVLFQVLVPFSMADGLTVCELLARVALNALEGAQTGTSLWFRNAVSRESSADKDPFWKHIVSAEFEYDRVR